MKKSVVLGLALAFAFTAQAEAGKKFSVQNIGESISKVGKNIMGAIKRTSGPAFQAMEGFKNFMTTKLTKAVDAAKNLGGRVQETFRNFTKNYAVKFNDLVKQAISKGKKVGQGFFTFIKNKAGPMINNLRNNLLSQGKKLLGGIKLPNLGGLVQKFQNNLNRGIEMAQKVASGALKRVPGMFTKVLDGFRGKLNSAGQAFRKLLPVKK